MSAMLLVSACSMAHESGEAAGLPTDSASGLCALPLEAPLELRALDRETALFIDPASGACRLDCAQPDCWNLGSPWVHVLTFTSLGGAEGNRVTNSFAGIGWLESASAGDLLGDGLLARVPFGVRTEVVLRNEPANLEIEFVDGPQPSLIIHDLLIDGFEADR